MNQRRLTEKPPDHRSGGRVGLAVALVAWSPREGCICCKLDSILPEGRRTCKSPSRCLNATTPGCISGPGGCQETWYEAQPARSGEPGSGTLNDFCRAGDELDCAGCSRSDRSGNGHSRGRHAATQSYLERGELLLYRLGRLKVGGDQLCLAVEFTGDLCVASPSLPWLPRQVGWSLFGDERDSRSTSRCSTLPMM